jgi:hypothetical protein
MSNQHFSSSRALRLLLVLLATLALLPATSLAQDEEVPEEPEEPVPPTPTPRSPFAKLFAGADTSATDFTGSLQVVRAPAGSSGSSKYGIEIFPEASRVWMSVRDTDPVPLERARRGGKWLCSEGSCSAQAGTVGASVQGDKILRTIKVQTPTLPIPVTIWRRRKSGPKLDFDPLLLGRKSYAHVCAYPPTVSDDPNVPRRDPAKIELCDEGKPMPAGADSAELLVGMEWPREAELAGFRYLAIVDACGNARVQPYQRNFTVPVWEVASGGCGKPDGKVLRVFPTGGFLRVTAFNLESPASGDVMNVTYRVSLPALENYSEDDPAKMLFPDLRPNDLRIDCGPSLRKGPVDAQGRPTSPSGGVPPMGTSPVWRDPPPPPDLKPTKPAREPTPGEEPAPADEPASGAEKADDDASSAAPGPRSAPPAGPRPPGAGPPPGPKPTAGSPAPTTIPPGPLAATMPPTTGEPGAKALDHGSLVIAPEPVLQGNCRLVMNAQTKYRLVAPLALHVTLVRTDKTTFDGKLVNLLPEDQSTWIVTANDAEFPLPPIRNEAFTGDSRLKLIVQSDPMNPNGKMVLVGDAGRVSSVLYNDDAGASDELARRTVGSVTIHTVPLCGESNFETLEEAGSCIRAYLTVPAMLATIQITRAPWVERPLITRTVLSAVGVALAFDSYDPVERTAFPIAGQVGGFVQNLGQDRIGLMGYVGVAPTLPILGEGGNTTSFGFLAGIGMSYITNANGPDEGFKPTAFLSAVVQVGQANPELSGQAFGSFSAN